jgi:hypothetical protein
VTDDKPVVSQPATAPSAPSEKMVDRPARSVAETKTVSAIPPPTKADVAKTNVAKPNLALVTPKNQFSATTLLIAGLALLLVACLLAWMLVRRTRSATQPSLISQSMDPPRK